jgi:hypothetical protein
MTTDQATQIISLLTKIQDGIASIHFGMFIFFILSLFALFVMIIRPR